VTAVETRKESSSAPVALTPPPPARAVGLALAAITAAAYAVGLGRPFDYDGSITVGLFVRHGSLLDDFRSVYAFNNQPYFSFVEHLVWSAGGHSEAWMRIVPIAAGVAAVGIVAAWVTARWGARAGIAAGAVLAANPMFATLSRSVRGYSLMVLGCTIATIVLVDARAHPETLTRARKVAYVAGLGIAIGTQVYALLVLAAHVVTLLVDRRFDRTWVRRIGGVVVVGALPYLGMVSELRAAMRARHGDFVPGFPASTAREVLGHDVIAYVLLGAVVAYVAVRVAWRRALAPAVVTIACAVTAIWIGLHPLDLYPRFLVWLVPVVAAAAAWFVARHPRGIALVAIAILAMIVTDATAWNTAPIASRAVAQTVEQARADHLRPCATNWDGNVLAGYTDAVTSVKLPASALACDVVFGIAQRSSALLGQIACGYRTVRVLPGTLSIVELSHPIPNRAPVC